MTVTIKLFHHKTGYEIWVFISCVKTLLVRFGNDKTFLIIISLDLFQVLCFFASNTRQNRNRVDYRHRHSALQALDNL